MSRAHTHARTCLCSSLSARGTAACVLAAPRAVSANTPFPWAAASHSGVSFLPLRPWWLLAVENVLQADREGCRLCAGLLRWAAAPRTPRMPPGPRGPHAERPLPERRHGSQRAQCTAGRSRGPQAGLGAVGDSWASRSGVGGVRSSAFFLPFRFPLPQSSAGPSALRHPLGISCRSLCCHQDL